jgi:RNA polymerase sigma-70 factor (ECF subfamily)
VDQSTWAQVSIRYQQELLSRAKREGIPPHDAEDIVQEVLKAAVNYKGTSGAEVRTFLIAILQNQIRKWIRKAGGSRAMVTVDSVADSLSDGSRDPSEIAGDAEVKALILKSFMELPDFCRLVCELRHVYGYSYLEISKELGIPLETVKSRLHRARKLLQESLSDIL